LATETFLNNPEKIRQAAVKVYLGEYSSMNDKRDKKNLHAPDEPRTGAMNIFPAPPAISIRVLNRRQIKKIFSTNGSTISCGKAQHTGYPVKCPGFM